MAYFKKQTPPPQPSCPVRREWLSDKPALKYRVFWWFFSFRSLVCKPPMFSQIKNILRAPVWTHNKMRMIILPILLLLLILCVVPVIVVVLLSLLIMLLFFFFIITYFSCVNIRHLIVLEVQILLCMRSICRIL